jgi:cellulose synthase/poly-beta-1,6-N-acetylglucosamine synthase-like glycosyltransferase
MRLAIIVPVAPFEKDEVILKSVEHLSSLDFDGFEVKILYVIDKNGESDSRDEKVRQKGADVLIRETTRGKRAGAINDGIRHLADFKPDYVAIFDVDSRPERNFVIECVKALKNCEGCYIASSKRYINNAINLVSETVEAEYRLMNFLLRKSSFKQFNGLIGVLKADILSEGLNEDAVAEDADFATRMHARGYRAVLVNTTKIYEQAPIRWRDLFNQRKRWYFGGLQLWRYWREVRKANWKFKLSWIFALTLTYIIILFSPLLILSIPLLLHQYRKISKLRVFFGLVAEVLILQAAAISASVDYLRKKRVEWKSIERVAE